MDMVQYKRKRSHENLMVYEVNRVKGRDPRPKKSIDI